MVNLSVIFTCSIVVNVNILVDVFNAVAGHFQHRHKEGFIIGGVDPSSVFVFHVVFFDLEEKTHLERSHMSKILTDESVVSVFDLSDTVGS